ncbi:ubiquitin-like-specific protease 1A [Aegilops tauschii subsp. strangulata]|uniref:ubiquitin-like-specific protease 1A n=1 Tax=Aegilops tauschii subsp. strangulata TaxID=200361 RepID=UPI001E1CAB02|nr:uncharacterized protein LOC120973489 isoform X2 [Aegilops tauschii subsp. strangulata]
MCPPSHSKTLPPMDLKVFSCFRTQAPFYLRVFSVRFLFAFSFFFLFFVLLQCCAVVVDLHETTKANVEVRGESNSLGKQSKKKRVAVSPDNVPTMKKIKVDAHGNALHHQYVMTRYKTRKPKKNELLPDFIEIDGFHTSLENFHASLKPRAEIDNEVMTLYLKTFNYDQSVKKKKPKKFVFSVLMSLKLSAEPDVFDLKVCEKEFKNACLQNHISKSDLLFFMVVHKRHWAVVVVNITQKEFNIFDSIRNSEDLFEMDRITKNVVANIKSVAMREPLFKHNLESYSLFTPLDYPQQKTYYNCGYYSILYVENWDGLVMLSFGQVFSLDSKPYFLCNSSQLDWDLFHD